MEAHEVLQKVKSGEISVEEAEQFFRREPFEEMGLRKDRHAQKAAFRIRGSHLLQWKINGTSFAYFW